MNLNTETVRKVIKWAAVVYTAPATFMLAGATHTDVLPAIRLPMQIAALMLIEGALLLGWGQLDKREKVSAAERWLYAGLTISAYVALMLVSVAQEGWQGWIFRLTLAALIGYSIAESGLLAHLAEQRRAERNTDSSRRVKRMRRKLETETRRMELQAQARADELQKEYERHSKSLQLQHQLQLQVIDSNSNSNSKSLQITPTPSRSNSNSNSNPKSPQVTPTPTPSHTNPNSKSERLEALIAYVNSNPALKPSDYVEWAESELGVSNTTAWNYWSEVKPEPIHGLNGGAR